MRLRSFLAYAAVGLSLSGCAGTMGNAVVDEQLLNDKGWGRASVLSTTAERRAVIVRVPSSDHNGAMKPEGNIQVCAEPSPDVAAAVTSSLSAALDAAMKTGGPDAMQLSASLASSYATALTVLTQRSQGVQMFRDGLYSLCQMYMNGALNKTDLAARYKELLEKTAHLVELELPLINQAKREQPLITAPTSTGEIKKQPIKVSSNAGQSTKNDKEAKKTHEEAKVAANPK